jgi:hypothetical protein
MISENGSGANEVEESQRGWAAMMVGATDDEPAFVTSETAGQVL